MQKLWKSDKNKEVVTFWNFTFFRKTFLDQSLWIFKWVSWWCHHLTIFYTFHLQNWQKSHIQLWECKPCFNPTQNKWEIMFILIYFDTRICFYLYLEKNENFQISCIIIWQIVRRWHHQLTHLNIHKDWSRNVFRKNVKFKMSQLPYFLSDFHHFCTNL